MVVRQGARLHLDAEVKVFSGLLPGHHPTLESPLTPHEDITYGAKSRCDYPSATIPAPSSSQGPGDQSGEPPPSGGTMDMTIGAVELRCTRLVSCTGVRSDAFPISHHPSQQGILEGAPRHRLRRRRRCGRGAGRFRGPVGAQLHRRPGHPPTSSSHLVDSRSTPNREPVEVEVPRARYAHFLASRSAPRPVHARPGSRGPITPRRSATSPLRPAVGLPGDSQP